MNLVKIADQGDNLETLKALRHKLAKAIEDSNSGRDISSLARQLQIVMAQISELEKERGILPGETALSMVRKKHGKPVSSEGKEA